MKGAKQTTLRDQVAVSGIGVHSGEPVTLTLLPGDDDTGIVFQRVTSDGSLIREVRADVRAVTATEFATVLGDAKGPLCSTAEHLLAALRGLNVDNVVVEIDGPEVPIMDGSAAPFLDALDQAGLTSRALPRRYIEVLKPVRVTRDKSFGELRPYAHGFRVEAQIDFDHPLIGAQALALDIDPKTFRNEIARARTFGFMKDVAKLWSAGYALGASFDNTLVISDDRVLNPEGLRYEDEFVRHKALDAIGDLALAGLPLIAAYKTIRGGHKLNHAVLSALMADASAWRVVEATETSRRGRAQVGAGLIAPAYGPDVS
jgi:UDP-3-O-[3-hydroxymyristoyl] N-acetylglucosamine deacetylase